MLRTRCLQRHRQRHLLLRKMHLLRLWHRQRQLPLRPTRKLEWASWILRLMQCLQPKMMQVQRVQHRMPPKPSVILLRLAVQKHRRKLGFIVMQPTLRITPSWMQPRRSWKRLDISTVRLKIVDLQQTPSQPALRRSTNKIRVRRPWLPSQRADLQTILKSMRMTLEFRRLTQMKRQVLPEVRLHSQQMHSRPIPIGSQRFEPHSQMRLQRPQKVQALQLLQVQQREQRKCTAMHSLYNSLALTHRKRHSMLLNVP